VKRDTITATRRERIIMFKRLKTWLVVCAECYQQREIERL
jgi:hypothetical protein